MTQVIVALDFPSLDPALKCVDLLGDRADFYKVGLQLYTHAGPAAIRELRRREKWVFLDLKYHDIPTTVAGAVEAAADEGVELLTLHANGGPSMLEAARDAAAGRVRVLGVTVLTSLSLTELEQIWGRSLYSIRDEVQRLAELASEAGLDGVVASVAEAEYLKRRYGPEFLVVTPGIRLPGQSANDQSRIATPAEAAQARVDFIVVGRTITRAPDPAAALGEVLEGVAETSASEA